MRTAFAAGCAGAFVFAWTDEWHRGGFDDRGLGLRADRPRARSPSRRWRRSATPSPRCRFRADAALAAGLGRRLHATTAQRTLARLPRGPARARLPRLRGDRRQRRLDRRAPTTIAARVRRPPDQHREPRPAQRPQHRAGTPRPARSSPTSTTTPAPTRTGCATSRTRFMTSATTPASAGPNIPPPGDGADRASASRTRPGGPIHVLLSDDEAEHIPGCNMAFRTRGAARRSAASTRSSASPGDDVDVCWRLQERGLDASASAPAPWSGTTAATRVRALPEAAARLRQGRGAARAQVAASATTAPATSPGRAASTATARPQCRGSAAGRIYYGTWGTGLFQSVYQPRRASCRSLPLMPEWYLVLAALLAPVAARAALDAAACRRAAARRWPWGPCWSTPRWERGGHRW